MAVCLRVCKALEYLDQDPFCAMVHERVAKLHRCPCPTFRAICIQERKAAAVQVEGYN